MELSKRVRWMIAGIIMLTLVAAVFYLVTRENVPDGILMVEMEGMEHGVSISDLEIHEVTGTVVNGKGEKKEINGSGCLMSEVLRVAGATDEMNMVTVVASDGFHAEISREEWMQPDQVYLLFQEEDGIQLVVFGDSDSKRRVKDVERLLVE